MSEWIAFLAGAATGVIFVWLGAVVYSYVVYRKNKKWG
jgi:hypothetical protein